MEKNYSQKIARRFEVADYILLFPALFGALLATLAFSPFTLIVYVVFILGVLLLVGYRRHARGNLSPESLTALWMGSAIYNLVLLLPCLYFAAILFQEKLAADIGFFLLCTLGVVFGFLAAIIGSVKAYQFERRRKFL